MARRHVLAFANGPADQVERMRADLAAILPGYEHHLIEDANWLELIHRFPPFSIAHTAALIDGEAAMLRCALGLAPMRMLAYNAAGDRFHLHPRQPVASLLFACGWRVHEVHQRPWRDETLHYDDVWRREGAPRPGRPRVQIVSPYLPWPLSHGGAVRIFSLLKESAARVELHLCAFLEEGEAPDPGPLLEYCASVTLVRKPKFQRLRWASWRPPEVLEFETPAMRQVLAAAACDIRQIEFTQLAGYGGDVLVEHDITMDLAAQEHARLGTGRSWWNAFRWRRYEQTALRRFRAVAVMSEKDRDQIAHPQIAVLPNGVDLGRFAPTPEPEGARMLFIGSFRHYPNALAYRFLSEEVFPEGADLEVVAGPQPQKYGAFRKPPGFDVKAFVEDVKPCYDRANLVLIPTPVSAGTNIKALEAMAAGRAILSTTSGVNGLGLVHGESVWIANGAAEFREAAARLLADRPLRAKLAGAARAIAVERFSWNNVARQQEELWTQLLV